MAKAWVESAKKSVADAGVLVEKGRLVNNERDAYLAATQTEYLEAKSALQLANDINTMMLSI